MTVYTWLYQQNNGKISLADQLYTSRNDAMEAARKWLTVWNHYSIDETENGYAAYMTDWSSVFSKGERMGKAGEVTIVSFKL